MSTKEQEMEALQKTKEILSGIDPNGYVATALDGCLEIAEDNIGNDFLCSMQQRADSATDEADAYRDLSEKYKHECIKYKAENEQLELRIAEDRKNYTSILQKLNNEVEEKETMIRNLDSMSQKLQEKEKEICYLKAKLYDFMTKEEEA